MEDVGTAAFTEILKAGGAWAGLLLISFGAIGYLFKQLMAAHKAFADREIARGAAAAAESKDTTEALVKVSEVVRSTSAAQEKSADSHRVLAESNRILADAVNRMMNWAERTRA